MADIVITSLKGHSRDAWDPAGYTRRHFGMFAGRPCRLRVRCRSELAGVVIDRFGLEAPLMPDGEDHFTAVLEVVVSPPFWGWLFGLGDGVEILSPGWALEEFRSRLTAVAALYGRTE